MLDSKAIMRKNTEGLNTGPGGPIGAQNDSIRTTELAGVARRQDPDALVAVMNDLQATPRPLAQLAHLLVRQGGVAAVDVSR